MTDTNAAFAEWLRTARIKGGLSQKKIADAMRAQGFDVFLQTTIAKIEAGDRPIRLDEAAALASLFGTTLDVALGLKEPESAGGFVAHDLVRRTALLQAMQRLIDAELGGGS